MGWALHAFSGGLSLEQIHAEILQARDLSKKGCRRRQLDYARRTAAKAPGFGLENRIKVELRSEHRFTKRAAVNI